MSMDLYLWKAPVIDDPDAAKVLLDRYFDEDDTSVFTPSPDIAAVAERLRSRYPDDPQSPADDCPWSCLPFDHTDRLLSLHIRWSADNAVLDSIVEIAAEHDLVIYDPQGPDVYRAKDAPTESPAERPTASDYFKAVMLVIPFAVATYCAWLIPWGWLRWPLVAVGLFFTAAALLVVYATVEAAFHPPGDASGAN